MKEKEKIVLERSGVSSKTLANRISKSKILYSVRDGDRILVSNQDIWAKIFDSDILECKNIHGHWKKNPHLDIIFTPKKDCKIDALEITLAFKLNGKIWASFIYPKIEKLHLWMSDKFEITLDLEEQWNGQ